MQEVESTYNDRKRAYDNVVSQLGQEKGTLDKDVKSIYDGYREDERKYHFQNIQNEIHDAFLKRINNEAKFVSQPDKKLTNEFKSY